MIKFDNVFKNLNPQYLEYIIKIWKSATLINKFKISYSTPCVLPLLPLSPLLYSLPAHHHHHHLYIQGNQYVNPVVEYRIHVRFFCLCKRNSTVIVQSIYFFSTLIYIAMDRHKSKLSEYIHNEPKQWGRGRVMR